MNFNRGSYWPLGAHIAKVPEIKFALGNAIRRKYFMIIPARIANKWIHKCKLSIKQLKKKEKVFLFLSRYRNKVANFSDKYGIDWSCFLIRIIIRKQKKLRFVHILK